MWSTTEEVAERRPRCCEIPSEDATPDPDGDRPLPLHLPFSPGLLVLVGAADADGCDEGGGRVRASCGRQDGVTRVATLRLLLVDDVGALSPSK